MNSWCLVALVYTRHCYLLVLLGPSFQCWCPFAPLRDCWAQHPFGVAIPRSWFCLLRRSTATARVYTCLLRVVMRGSSPLLLLVAIELVSTIQLSVWKVVIWLLLFSFSQTVPTDDAKIVNELPSPYML